MASRKAASRARDKKRGSSRDVAAPDSERPSSPASSQPVSSRPPASSRPSSSMTVEIEALSVTDLINAARVLPPAPPTTARNLDDLAATVEVPALSSIGPRVLIMDAAEAVIAERGYNHTTIREVAKFSGVSVDVFHAHFADMRALFVALVERFSERAMSVVDEATRPSRWDGGKGDLGDRALEYAIRTVIDFLLNHAAIVRAIFGSTERPLIDELRRIGTHLTIRLTRLLNDLPRAPDPRDIGFAVLSALALAQHAVTVGPEWSGIELDRDDVAKRAANMAVAYVESTRRSR